MSAEPSELACRIVQAVAMELTPVVESGDLSEAIVYPALDAAAAAVDRVLDREGVTR